MADNTSCAIYGVMGWLIPNNFVAIGILPDRMRRRFDFVEDDKAHFGIVAYIKACYSIVRIKIRG